MQSYTNTSRSLSADCSRILAVLAVVMIHVTMDFYQFENSTLSYMLGNVFDSLSRYGVPLFVMISGALMLDENKNIPIKKLFTKYILNVVLLFVSWSIICTFFATVEMLSLGKEVSFSEVIINLVFGGFHMWYLIMIIGLYLTVPILKLFVKKENSDKIAYIILVSLFFVFLPPLLSSLSSISGVFSFAGKQLARFEYGFIGVYPTYFITGWYVFHVGIKHKKTVCLLAVNSVLLVILSVQVTGDYTNAYSNGNILIYAYSLGVFTFINSLCKNRDSKRSIETLSKLTFGVYIVHVLVLRAINLLFDSSQLTLLSVVARFGLTTVISFAISYIMSIIPGVRKLVRF